MKPLLFLCIIAGSLAFTGCEATVAEYRTGGPSYVERDVYYRTAPRREVAVYRDRPDYYRRTSLYRSRGPHYDTRVRYYSDGNRRYYMREGRRIYVNIDR